MIPKKLHYCWFGNGEKPKLTVRCMESWKKHLGDYEWIEWNESNFDVRCNPYVSQAYDARKFAFVSDYVRLWALYHQGGVYVDTDVEIISSLDEFLILDGFSGFESNTKLPTGIMASIDHLSIIGELLAQYDGLTFLKADGQQDKTTNTVRITDFFLEYGIKMNNTRQTIERFTFFPKDVFCAKDIFTGRVLSTANTHTIHHFAGSWHEKKDKRNMRVRQHLNALFGVRRGEKLYTRWVDLKGKFL